MVLFTVVDICIWVDSVALCSCSTGDGHVVPGWRSETPESCCVSRVDGDIVSTMVLLHKRLAVIGRVCPCLVRPKRASFLLANSVVMMTYTWYRAPRLSGPQQLVGHVNRWARACQKKKKKLKHE